MDGVIDKTNWIIGGHNRVVNVLRAMGVKVKGGGFFWKTNEEDLEYIYQDFRKRERQLKSRYHPDRKDGDAEVYRQLVNDCDLVRRQMERRGVIKLSATEIQERREMADERHRARTRAMMHDHRNNGNRPKRPGRARNRPHVPLEALFTTEEIQFLSKEELLRRRKRRNKAQWRLVPGNVERERQTKKRYYEAKKGTMTPEERERRNAYMREYIKRPERMVKNYRSCRRYRLAHPEKVKQWKKNYAEKTKGRPRFRKYPEGRCKKGTPAWERRKEYRRERWEANREELNRKRRIWYAGKRGTKYKQPRIKDHKGRFLPALEAAA
jgi:hypothetical protein